MPKYLLINLRTTPELFLIDSLLPQQFKIFDEQYTDLKFGDFNGFYDWLRVKSGKIIGIRFKPFDESELIAEYTHHLPYCRLNYSGKNLESLEIYFSKERDFDFEISNDAYFGGNNLYVTENQTLAIIFDIERRENPYAGLSEAELKSLGHYNAKPTQVF